METVEIIGFEPAYREWFYKINAEWIETFFKLEAGDINMLQNPEREILEPDGHIFFAKLGEAIVGTCALIKMPDNKYELAKMGVTPAAQGKKAGYLLMQAAIAKAKTLGADALMIETNSSLKPAIALYEKCGFKHIPLHSPDGSPHFERGDTMMKLDLTLVGAVG